MNSVNYFMYKLTQNFGYIADYGSKKLETYFQLSNNTFSFNFKAFCDMYVVYRQYTG